MKRGEGGGVGVSCFWKVKGWLGRVRTKESRLVVAVAVVVVVVVLRRLRSVKRRRWWADDGGA